MPGDSGDDIRLTERGHLEQHRMSGNLDDLNHSKEINFAYLDFQSLSRRYDSFAINISSHYSCYLMFIFSNGCFPSKFDPLTKLEIIYNSRLEASFVVSNARFILRRYKLIDIHCLYIDGKSRPSY